MEYYNYDTGAFRGYCVLCGDGHAKRDMNKILISYGRYGHPKMMAHVCVDCSSKVADYLGVELPDEETQRRRLYEDHRCPHCRTSVKKTDRYCWYCGEQLGAGGRATNREVKDLVQ